MAYYIHQSGFTELSFAFRPFQHLQAPTEWVCVSVCVYIIQILYIYANVILHVKKLIFCINSRLVGTHKHYKTHNRQQPHTNSAHTHIRTRTNLGQNCICEMCPWYADLLCSHLFGHKLSSNPSQDAGNVGNHGSGEGKNACIRCHRWHTKAK